MNERLGNSFKICSASTLNIWALFVVCFCCWSGKMGVDFCFTVSGVIVDSNSSILLNTDFGFCISVLVSSLFSWSKIATNKQKKHLKNKFFSKKVTILTVYTFGICFRMLLSWTFNVVFTFKKVQILIAKSWNNFVHHRLSWNVFV